MWRGARGRGYDASVRPRHVQTRTRLPQIRTGPAPLRWQGAATVLTSVTDTNWVAFARAPPRLSLSTSAAGGGAASTSRVVLGRGWVSWEMQVSSKRVGPGLQNELPGVERGPLTREGDGEGWGGLQL